jgi:predicted amidohydrolase YtcJ
LGRGWDQNDWPDRQFPTHAALTEAAADRPVFLTRICGHAGWANRAALELAGIGPDTPDPPGGRILRDEDGQPTGVLIDAAQGLVAGKIPPPGKEETAEALELAVAECPALGLTGVHDAGCGLQTLDLLRQLAAEGRLPLRVYAMLSGDDRKLLGEAFARGREVGLADHRLTIRAVKLFADGALGSRGAALLEPYADAPEESGLVILSGDRIAEVSKRALAAGFQVCTHAIGDRANRVALDAYQRAFLALPHAADPRFRIEHAQILDAQDVPRFAELGVIASVQSTHATSDMPWVHDRIGPDRAREGAYLWQTLLDAGARICNGSDAPVESLNPLFGIYAAITRQDHAGHPPGGWYPRQRLTRMRALESFTRDAAYAAFEENLKGSLEVGKLADLVVWSNDFLEVPPPEILTTRAEITVLGGEVVYRRTEP